MNPLAKLLAALIIAVTLLFTLNPWIALLFVVIELVGLPFLGVSARTLVRVSLTLGVAAALAGITNALYGTPSGDDLWMWGPIHVTAGSLVTATSVTLRILAIGLPGAVLMSTVDPTDLADALAQLGRVPARFVYGSLAAVRMLALLLDDWNTLGLARRARGLGSGRGPIAAVGRYASQTFALFVISLRRGDSLAIAMDARGLSASSHRSWARTSVWHVRDWIFVLAVGAFSSAAVALGMVLTHG